MDSPYTRSDQEAVTNKLNEKTVLSKNKKRRNNPKTQRYDPFVTNTVQWIYFLSIILWILLVFLFRFNRTTIFGYIILAIPIFIYIIGYINAKSITVEVEDNVFAANYLSVGLIIVLPLLTWLDKKENMYKGIIVEAMILAIMLSMISLIDVWVEPKWLSIVKHIKSILQTASLALLIYALYMFYVGRE